MRLGTRLLRDAVITLTQLEQALRAQVLSGGRLGTNLVDLGFVDLNTLGRYLARVADLPLAIADRFEKADPKLIEAFGAEMADRHTAVPLGFEHDDRHTAGVAMHNPEDQRAIAAIENYLDLSVRPYIAAELRLFYYLERFYGIRRRTRFTRSAVEEDAGPSSRRERRLTQPFRGIQTPTTVSIAPRKRRTAPVHSAMQSMMPVSVSFDGACSMMAGATHRDHIAMAILEYSIGRFECAAIFLVRAGNAIGWLAQAPGLGQDALERLNIPLGGASIFQAAHDSGKPYRGNALSPGHPLETELWSRFALEHEPTDMHVVPICINGKVVNLIYAHRAPGVRVNPEHVDQLIELTARAVQSYERMLNVAATAD